jgi:hypothetical protein
LENSPLIISFLFQEYKAQNKITIASEELMRNLTDTLYHLREFYNDSQLYPEKAENYLNTWTNLGYLRKYYTQNSDEPFFDLTPATEKMLEWLQDLDKKEFVGTESRLLKIFDLLKELSYKNSKDPQKRLRELERQKKEIEDEIAKINNGFLDQLDSTQIKERFYDLEDTTRKLLSDFKQVEYNFRELDRVSREKQINENLTKGKFLENVFKIQDLLWDTDQGKSFKAFWELLMSRTRQEELESLLAEVVNIPEIREIKKDNFIDRLKINLVEAGSKVNKTNHLLIEQLSRYLTEQAALNNKRIIELVKSIKNFALAVKEDYPKESEFITFDDKPRLNSVMSRALFVPTQLPVLNSERITVGEGGFDADLLYQLVMIDKEELKQHITELLRYRTQVSLLDISEHFPIKRGVAEVIAYLDIAEKASHAFINEAVKEEIAICNEETDSHFLVQVNQVIFARSGEFS